VVSVPEDERFQPILQVGMGPRSQNGRKIQEVITGKGQLEPPRKGSCQSLYFLSLSQNKKKKHLEDFPVFLIFFSSVFAGKLPLPILLD